MQKQWRRLRVARAIGARGGLQYAYAAAVAWADAICKS